MGVIDSPRPLRMSSSRFDDALITRKRIDGTDIDDDEKYRINFISQTARGTNDYRHKTHLLYLTNFFPNPLIKNFLISRDEIQIDMDAYALSNLLQWIWRSAIRDGQEITVFIPAERVRHLLMKWLGYTDDELF